jgi:hypothetical protein
MGVGMGVGSFRHLFPPVLCERECAVRFVTVGQVNYETLYFLENEGEL